MIYSGESSRYPRFDGNDEACLESLSFYHNAVIMTISDFLTHTRTKAVKHINKLHFAHFPIGSRLRETVFSRRCEWVMNCNNEQQKSCH